MRGVAFDLDGTLLRSDHTVLPRILPVLKKLTDQGVWITLASARPPRSVRAIAQPLNLPGPFVALNGAAIVAKGGSRVELVEIRQDIARTLVERYRTDARMSVSVYTDQDWLAQSVDERVLAEVAAVGFRPDPLPATEAVAGVAKILLMVDLDEVPHVLDEVAPYRDHLHIATSAPTFVEITAKAATKAHGLEIAARTQGFGIAEMLVAGDGWNDLPMVLAAGYSIAMQHAPQALKDAATQVVGTNEDGSLAVAVEQAFHRAL